MILRKTMLKPVICFLAAVLISGLSHIAEAGSTQTQGTQMEQNILTKRQQSLIVMGALEAKGDLPALKDAIHQGLDAGVTVSEAKEALSQLYAYTGFPRSLNALGILQQVITEREAKGLKTEKGREADPLPENYNALASGTAVQTQLAGKPFTYAFAPQTDFYLKAHLFGDIFSRNNLSFADREMVTIAAISSLNGCEPQLAAHMSGSQNMGVTQTQLRAITRVLENVGETEANRAKQTLAKLQNEPVKTVETVDFSVWPKGEPNTAYAKYFTGNSYLADMGAKDGGPYNVTFEPGCRNHWHVHHKAVQVLVAVAGRGWYQEWGKPAVKMVPGTVITIPAGVKHWHGAAKDAWFQHLAYATHVEKDDSNAWLEPVSDEQYDRLQ